MEQVNFSLIANNVTGGRSAPKVSSITKAETVFLFNVYLSASLRLNRQFHAIVIDKGGFPADTWYSPCGRQHGAVDLPGRPADRVGGRCEERQCLNRAVRWHR